VNGLGIVVADASLRHSKNPFNRSVSIVCVSSVLSLIHVPLFLISLSLCNLWVIDGGLCVETPRGRAVTSDAELVDAFGMAHMIGENKLLRLHLVAKGTNPSLLASVAPSAPSHAKTVDVDLTSLLSSLSAGSGAGAQPGSGANPIVTLLSNLLAASTSNQQQHQHQHQQQASCPWMNARNEEGARVHMYYVCDGCEVTPVVGNLFQCDTCPDYHLCESCRNAGVHMEKNHTFTVNPSRHMPAHGHRHGFHHGGRRGQCCAPSSTNNSNANNAAQKPLSPASPIASPFGQSPLVPTHSNNLNSNNSNNHAVASLTFAESPAKPVVPVVLPVATKPPVPVVSVPITTPVKPIGIVETTNKSPLVPQVQVVPTERLEMAFLSDVTIPDGTEVNAGETFNKVWRLSNSGHATWPLGCRLSLESNTGERLSSVENIEIPGEVPPGSAVTISVEMEAPKKSGRHVSYWRMHGPTGQAFGNRIWVDIISNEKPAAPVLLQPSAPAVVVPAAAPATALEPAKFSANEQHATQLEALYRMGFLNVDLNRNLLEHNKGNLSAVIDELVSRQY